MVWEKRQNRGDEHDRLKGDKLDLPNQAAPEAIHQVGEGPWNTILFKPSMARRLYVHFLALAKYSVM
jgi:hypothetical protein